MHIPYLLCISNASDFITYYTLYYLRFMDYSEDTLCIPSCHCLALAFTYFNLFIEGGHGQLVNMLHFWFLSLTLLVFQNMGFKLSDSLNT